MLLNWEESHQNTLDMDPPENHLARQLVGDREAFHSAVDSRPGQEFF